jgi:hypothetical protein
VAEVKDYSESFPRIRLSVESTIPGRLLAEVINVAEAAYGKDTTRILTEASDEPGVPPNIVIMLKPLEPDLS